jgi:3-isopropylmalate/(R)-2-methylmalate dehydratase small subunit
VQQNPGVEITVDLISLTVSCGELQISVELADSAREALTTGQWDYLGRLLSAADQVQQHASSVPYLNSFNTTK